MGDEVSIRGFFGGLFFAIGLLIAILSGGCTFIFATISLQNGTPNDFFGLVLMIGGVPFIVGIILIGVGRLIWGARKVKNRNTNPYAIPEEMRENEERHLKENLKKDNPFIDEEN